MPKLHILWSHPWPCRRKPRIGKATTRRELEVLDELLAGAQIYILQDYLRRMEPEEAPRGYFKPWLQDPCLVGSVRHIPWLLFASLVDKGLVAQTKREFEDYEEYDLTSQGFDLAFARQEPKQKTTRRQEGQKQRSKNFQASSFL